MKPLDIDIEITDAGGFAYEADRFRVSDYLRFAFAGRKCRLRISEPKRSSRANAYWWGCCLETIRRARLEVGMPPVPADDLHRHFKAHYLPVRTVNVFGVDYTWEGSTADLDSTTFFEFVENVRLDEDVRQLMALSGLEIPDPDPQYRSYKLADVS